MGDVAVADRAAQGPHHVGLAPQLAEAARPEAPVEGRRIPSVLGHRLPDCDHPLGTVGSLRGSDVAPALGAAARLATAHGLTR